MLTGKKSVLFNDYRKQPNISDFTRPENRNTNIPQSFHGSLVLCGFPGGHIIGIMQNVYLNGAQIPEKKNIELPKYRMPEGNPDAADESLMPEGWKMDQAKEKRQLRGSLLLLLGSVIWGAAFAAQRAGMDHLGPMAFTGIRMLLGAAVLTPMVIASERKREKSAPEKKEQRKAGILCGLFLFVASILQQAGLVSTTAGKAGFITALYVVLVPVAAWVIFRKNPGRMIWVSVALAVAALYMLCLAGNGVALQTGDLLVLGCAVCFTGQILCVDYYAPRVSGIRLARDEFLITGALAMIIALFTETIAWEGIREALIPILYTGIMSSAVGYTLQIYGQRDTDPTIASLLMCLESVFAVLTGALLLGERMSDWECAGCVVMFAAVILAQLSPALGRRRRSVKVSGLRSQVSGDGDSQGVRSQVSGDGVS